MKLNKETENALKIFEEEVIDKIENISWFYINK
jgi:hypothetical protein